MGHTLIQLHELETAREEYFNLLRRNRTVSHDWTIEKADDYIARLTASQQAILQQLDCVYMPQALVKIRDLQAQLAQAEQERDERPCVLRREDGSFSVYYPRGGNHMVLIDSLDLKYAKQRSNELEAERENSLIALQILLDARGCLTLENEIEVPEEISAEFDCGLIQAQQVIDAYKELAQPEQGNEPAEEN